MKFQMKNSVLLIFVCFLCWVRTNLCCHGGLRRSVRSFFDSSPSHNEALKKRISGPYEIHDTEPDHPDDRIIRINAPGQRFTATHGVSLKKYQQREFVFVIDRDDVNYMAISSNIAIRGTKGGPEKFEIYLKYGSPALPHDYDQKSTLTASESYIDNVLYSRDITLPNPEKGNYYVLLEALEDFHELLLTAIMDYPPDPELKSQTH